MTRRTAAESVAEVRLAWENLVSEYAPAPLHAIEGVEITPKQAPRTYRVAAAMADRLGITPPRQVLCAATTAARGTPDGWRLFVAPAEVTALDDEALAAHLGHTFASATWTTPTRPFGFDGPGMTVEALFAMARFSPRYCRRTAHCRERRYERGRYDSDDQIARRCSVERPRTRDRE